MNKKYHEGIMYCIIGLVFFLITIDLIFPIVMFMLKVLFILLGSLAFIGGLIQIKDSYKKRKTDEN